MIFAPRKKIIASRFKQRGNLVTLFPGPLVPPEIDKFVKSQCVDMTPGSRSPVGVWVNQDGDKLAIADQQVISPDKWQQFSLANAHDLDTLTAVESELSFTTPVRISGVFLTEDGLKMFSTSRSPTHSITRNAGDVPFSIPFDISTQSQQFGLGLSTAALSIHVSPDGLNFYIYGGSGFAFLRQYIAVNAFDPVGAVFANSIDTSLDLVAARGITLSSDGTRLFVLDVLDAIADSEIHQYDLSVGFDLSTAIYSGKFISAQDSDAGALHLADDDRLYVAYAITAATVGVCKFLQAGGDPFVPPLPPVPPPPVDEWFESEFWGNPESVGGGFRNDVFWKADGTRVWTVRDSSNRCDQHDVSPAWAVSPGSWSNLVSNNTNFVDPRSVWISPDGTILLFQTGAGTMQAATLSTPFDLSTLGAFSAVFMGTNFIDQFWSADGTRLWLYFTSGVPNTIREYAVPTPFDVSSILPNAFTDVAQFDLAPDLGGALLNSFQFSPDGRIIYGISNQGPGLNVGSLVQWTLSTPFDITTAGSFVQGIGVGEAAEIANPRGLGVRLTDGCLFVFRDQSTQQVKVFCPIPPPPVVPEGNASEYYLVEISAGTNPGVSGAPARLDVFWKQDGTRVWTSRQGGPIRQFDVSPPWGIDFGDWTLTFTTANITNLRTIWWSADGNWFAYNTRVPATSVAMFIFDQSATPHDISGGFGPGTSKAWTPTGGATAHDIIMSEDGTRLWMQSPIGITAPIREFHLTVPFDATSIINAEIRSFDGVSSRTLTFSTLGEKLFYMNGQALTSRDMSVPFDINTLSDPTVGPSVPAFRVSIPRGLTVRASDGDIFTAGDQGSQMRLGRWKKTTAPTLSNFASASYTGDISAGSDDPGGVWVSPDGINVFVASDGADNEVHSYTLGTPFDLSTISAKVATLAINTSPWGVFLKPDGTKIFVTAFGGSVGVQEFTLSTPFDLTTAGAMTLLDTTVNGATIPFGTHFSPDGLNVYVSDNGGSVYQWSLAVAWDVSAPTFIGSFNFSTALGSTIAATKGQDLSLSDDGRKLYIPDLNVGTDTEIVTFNVTVPFDITSTFYNFVKFTLTGRIGGSGFHLMPAEPLLQNRYFVAWNGDAGGADPQALEEFKLGGDIAFSSVVLLLDFAGADGAQNISDLSNSAHNAEVFNQAGTLEVDTAIQYLGKNTLLLVPTSGVVTTGGSNNRVLYSSDPDWQFGNGDFTVELGIRFLDNSLRQNLISSYDATGLSGWSLQWFTGNQLVWVANAPMIISAGWTPNALQQYHLAVSRVAGTTYLFVDGVLFGSSLDATNYVQVEGLALGVLTNNANPNVFPVEGNIGAVRITKGVGRYNASFTPPSIFYPTF